MLPHFINEMCFSVYVLYYSGVAEGSFLSAD